MTCAGCGGVFGLGAKIEPRGAGFVHAGRDECGRAADEKAPAIIEKVSRREASLERDAARTMLAELCTEASSTSKDLAEYTRLEEAWAASVGGGVVLPRYSVESMLEFITWLAKDSGRARSFETILRAAGGVIAKTTANGLMSDRRVKALRARMVDLIGATNTVIDCSLVGTSRSERGRCSSTTPASISPRASRGSRG